MRELESGEPSVSIGADRAGESEVKVLLLKGPRNGWELQKGEEGGVGTKLTRQEVRILRRHESGPLGSHCRYVPCAVGAQMLRSHSVFPLWLSDGQKAKWRQRGREPWRSRVQVQGSALHRSCAGREEQAKEPLRWLHSC